MRLLGGAYAEVRSSERWAATLTSKAGYVTKVGGAACTLPERGRHPRSTSSPSLRSVNLLCTAEAAITVHKAAARATTLLTAAAVLSSLLCVACRRSGIECIHGAARPFDGGPPLSRPTMGLPLYPPSIDCPHLPHRLHLTPPLPQCLPLHHHCPPHPLPQRRSRVDRQLITSCLFMTDREREQWWSDTSPLVRWWPSGRGWAFGFDMARHGCPGAGTTPHRHRCDGPLNRSR